MFRTVGRSLICAVLGVVAFGIFIAPGYAQQDQSTEKVYKVITIERQPFSFVSDNQFSGFSIDLWRALAEQLELSYEFVSAENFDGMLLSVQNGQADAAIANISITAEREVVMDFTQPIYDSGLQIMIPERDGGTGLVAALVTWDMFKIVGLGLLVLFLAGSLMWVFERRAQPFFEYPYKEGSWRSFWWALNVVVNGGFEERMPMSWPGRFFAVIVVISSLFVVSIFVAKITATLTISELRSSIESISDLHGKKVGTTAGSTSASFLRSRSVRVTEFDNINDLFKALEQNELHAVVHDAPILAYYAQNAGKGVVRTTGAVFRPEKYGIALPQGSSLVEPINRGLLRLREDGTYEELISKWFGDRFD